MSDPVAATVIIPTVGRVEQLALCLDSLAACDPRAAEILVTVQGDPEPTTGLVERFAHIGARVVACAGTGLGRNMNFGLRHARHEAVLTTDDDCTVTTDWVGRGWAHLAARPDAIITGRVLATGNPAAVPSTITDPEPRDYTGQVRIGALYRGNMAVRRSLLLDAGGFDERIVPSAEDNDLCYRWLRAGRPLRYEPDMVVWHHDWRSREQLRRVYAGYGLGQGAFYAKHLRAGDVAIARFVARDVVACLRLVGRTLRRGRRPSSDVRLEAFRQVPGGLVTAWPRFGSTEHKDAVLRRPFWLRDALKRHLPPTWRRRARHLSRLRWISKARLLRAHQIRWRDHPFLALGYLLLDPEVESFTYELANREELLDFAADTLNHDRAAIARYAAETEHDIELLRPPRRLWVSKRRLPLGNRLLWYVMARATKPALVVETGIHDGLGSLTLLRALERNAQEGSAGRLISFDVFADVGWLVDERLRGRWQCVHGSTLSALEPSLRGLRVDMSVHDASDDEANQRAEFESVLRHRGDRLLIVNGAGANSNVLSEICAREGVRERRFLGRSTAHIHPGGPIAVAVFPATCGTRSSDA